MDKVLYGLNFVTSFILCLNLLGNFSLAKFNQGLNYIMKRLLLICILFCCVGTANAQDFNPKTIYEKITDLIIWDEFNDNLNEWFVGENNNAPSSIEAGNYFIRLKTENTTWHRWNTVNNLHIDPNRDFVIEMFVSQVMGEDNRAYGIRWGTDSADDINASFCFFISSNGYYRLQNGTKVLQDWVVTPSVIQGIDQENKLMIVRKNGITYFFVNYELVHTIKNKWDTGNMIQNIGFAIGGQITIAINELVIGYLN